MGATFFKKLFGGGASVQNLDKIFGVSVPPDVIALFANPSALDSEPELMRLMKPSEAAEETRKLRESWLQLGSDALVLWSDDQSNYAGVYVSGDLATRVFILDLALIPSTRPTESSGSSTYSAIDKTRRTDLIVPSTR